MRVDGPCFHPEDFPRFEEAWRQGGKQALIQAVPDTYVRGMTASGTPQQVQAKVQQFRDVGVRLPILRPATAHQAERLLNLFTPN
jgi:5,10-methylenetetrahydromethanopterin reductase